MSDAAAASAAPRGLDRLPWKFAVLLFLAVILGAVAAALVVPGSGGAAIAGIACGLFGAVMASRTAAALGLAALLAALGLAALVPHVLVLWAAALALAALAGYEAAHSGGRALVMALYGFLLLLLSPGAPDPVAALPVVAAAGLWGLAVASLPGLAGVARPPPGGRRFGLGLAGFLAAGVAVGWFAETAIPNPHAHWIALLFVFRAVAPPGERVKGALRFGLGAAAGSLAALLLALLDPPRTFTVPLAAALGLVGVRMLPHPVPWSPAAFSAAVLLATAPGADAALFRLESVLLVVALAAGLATVVGLVWDLGLWLLQQASARDAREGAADAASRSASGPSITR